MGVLRKGYGILAISGAIYITFLSLLLIPYPQRVAIFLNDINFPFFMNFRIPERVGFGFGKVRNLQIPTGDGEIIGAWHVLPDSIYFPMTSISNVTYDQALMTRPVVLYCHGNAANRAAPFRTEVYRHLTSRLDYNVIAIDYRGFGDSTGIPSEDGLYEDIRSTFNWIRERGTPADQIIFMGQSLGTGVVVNLAKELSNQGIKIKALITVAAYTSIPQLLYTYKLFKTIPILSPLSFLPWLQNFALKAVKHRFESIEKIADVNSPIIIIHGTHDMEIGAEHSRDLFFKILRKEMGSVNETKIDRSLLPMLHLPITKSSDLSLLSKAKDEGKLDVRWFDSPTSEAGENAGSLRILTRNGKENVYHLEIGYGGHNDVQSFDLTSYWIKKILS